MNRLFSIRAASTADVSALLDIYRPYVEGTTISFELEVPALVEFAGRVEKAQSKWCWLVAEVASEVVGYAYGSAHRAREAYANSVETSAYVKASHHRNGIARGLYEQLLERLKAMGYESAYAGITLPNEPSVALHRSLGFEPIGVFPRVGYKFGEWHDVAWSYRPLAESRPRHLQLVIEREMATPPHALYLAWTSRFDAWFAAAGTVSMVPEVDRPYFFEVRHDGQRHPHYGRFLRLEPDRVVEMTWVTAAGTKGAETVLTVELTPSGSGTQVKLTHSGFLDEASRDGHEEAWPKALEHLDKQFSA